MDVTATPPPPPPPDSFALLLRRRSLFRSESLFLSLLALCSLVSELALQTPLYSLRILVGPGVAVSQKL